MSRTREPLDLRRIRTYPLSERANKMDVGQFAKTIAPEGSLEEFLQALPNVLAADALKDVAAAVVEARRRDKPVVLGTGAHTVKCGLSPILIDLMARGMITAIAMNGAGAIHDFEIAMIGATSEDVSETLPQGRFGMADETGRWINEAIHEGASHGRGIGESLGRRLEQLSPEYGAYSLLLNAWMQDVPLTVHVAIGTDIVHMHPSADGAAIGAGSLLDFRIFAAQIAEIGGGGVYLNVGSAVLLPEVFLKAVSLANNLGPPLTEFTTANFDMIRHYRPTENVIRRPVASGGRGHTIIGANEIIIPLLAAMILIEDNARSGTRVDG